MTVTSAVLGVSYLTHVPQARTDDDGTTEDGTTDSHVDLLNLIGLYRESAIAIESEARDPFGGHVYYVTMQITFPVPEFARKGRNSHCDVVHVATK